MRPQQATHQRHEEEQARIRKRGERQRTYLPAMDEGWQQKVPVSMVVLARNMVLMVCHGGFNTFQRPKDG